MKKIVSLLLLVILALLFPLLLVGCGSNQLPVFSGTIEGKEIPVTAPIAGQLMAVDREEGEEITPLDRLAKIDDESLLWQLKEVTAVFSGADARWEEVKAGSREQQVHQAIAAVEQVESLNAQANIRLKQASANQAQAEAQLVQIKSQWQGAKNSLAYQEKQLENIEKLYAAQAIAARELDTQREIVNQALTQEQQLQAQHARVAAQLEGVKAEYEAANAQLAIIAAQKKSALAQLSLLEEGATSFTLQNALAVREQAQAKVEQVKILVEKTEVHSPISGTILRKHVELGEQVMPGSLLYTIIDLGSLEVTVYVPEADLQLVQLGQEVSVQVAAYPGETFTGKVARINSKAEFTPKNVQTAKERTSLVFAVNIALTEGRDQLRPGMSADVILSSNKDKGTN